MNLKKVGNNSYRISCHRPSPDYNPAFMSSPSPRLVTLVISSRGGLPRYWTHFLWKIDK